MYRSSQATLWALWVCGPMPSRGWEDELDSAGESVLIQEVFVAVKFAEALEQGQKPKRAPRSSLGLLAAKWPAEAPQ